VCAPGQQDCSSNGVRTCDATGQFGTASKCTNKTCVASGTTASCVGTCEPTQTQCTNGSSIQTCGANGTFAAAVACATSKPYCYSNTCNAEPPSCAALAPNCGPGESCCTSLTVTGAASFKRDNDPNYTATVGNFRLDKYEVTVGRFRQFVAAVVGGWTPTAGSGKHTHLNGGAGLKDAGGGGNETGWDTAWNAKLPSDKTTWDGPNNLGADARYQTWTPSSGINENLPINCVNWFQAAAFCIWDEGFLPSEAEWNYAAAGGIAQRTYPWGATEPGNDTSLAVYGCYFNHVAGNCVDTTNIAPVGSVPAGNGFFGHADLAGNINEWILDGEAPYSVPCVNCAYLQLGNGRLFRGGAWDSTKAPDLATSVRINNNPDLPNSDTGLRCARTP
jgi:formylglycine-generating enzyme required for sulfatase activity